MMRGLLTLAAVLLAATPVSAADEPSEVEVSQLIVEPGAWADRVVDVTGELVGDYSYRDDMVWFQLNDDPYVEDPIREGGPPVGANTGIGGRAPRGLFEAAVEGGPGRYQRIGPIVRVEARYVVNDLRLGGETYLDVIAITQLAPARLLAQESPDVWLSVGAALMLMAGVIAWSARSRQLRREAQENTTRSSR